MGEFWRFGGDVLKENIKRTNLFFEMGDHGRERG